MGSRTSDSRPSPRHAPSRPLLLLTLFAAFAAAFATTLAPAAAEDWPQWRGADRLGRFGETGIVERFPETGLQVAWRTPVGSGFAGPAVADGRVFVLDFQPDSASTRMEGVERLLVLDEQSGKPLWHHQWPAGYGALQASYATGPRATPTVDGGLVFVVGAVGQLTALDVASGKPVWHHDTVAEYGTSVPVWGIASAPIVEGNLLIAIAGAEPDGKVMAFDKRTGKEVWRALSSNWEMGYAQPIIIDAGGVRQLIVWHPKAVSALDPETGKVYWEVAWEVGMGMTVATPVISGDRLFFTQFYHGSLMLELGRDAPTVKEMWRVSGRNEMPDATAALHSLITTPVFDRDTVYGVDSYGELRALDAADGKRLWSDTTMTRQGRWGTAFAVELTASGDGSASGRGGRRWLVNNDQGELLLARFERDRFVEIDRTQLIEPTSRAGYGPQRFNDAGVNWVHPAYANGHLVTRNDREAIRVSLRASDYPEAPASAKPPR